VRSANISITITDIVIIIIITS